MTVLCAWQFRGNAPARFRTFAGLGLLIACCTLVHGIWYLWALPVAAFFIAGEFRWGIGVGIAWLAGSFLGALFTGHPIGSLLYALRDRPADGQFGREQPEAMVTELRPFSGDFLGLSVLGGLLILRRLGGINARPGKTAPCSGWCAFAGCWGSKPTGSWADWGWPALMILVVSDLQLILEARLSFDSPKRLALAVGLAVMTFLATTNNSSSGWTQNTDTGYLTQDNRTSKAGCRTRAASSIPPTSSSFSRRFSKNPTADWKYILGFEPALMPDEDFAVYRTIRGTHGKAWAFLPWVNKMRPQDRLMIRGGGQPPLSQLEWKYDEGSDIWIGRLPVPHPPTNQTNKRPGTLPAGKPGALPVRLEHKLDVDRSGMLS